MIWNGLLTVLSKQQEETGKYEARLGKRSGQRTLIVPKC